ncbi:MAG: protein kinase [Actinobacteria bacterium]|nr:protein kinase [Actinomycetota bacterium]
MALDRRLVVDALPSYEIGEEIGRGGWGVVLAGRHRELGRNVAIKQLPRAFAADPSVRSRFKDEARLIASLDHPHIVPVYDFVEREGLCLIVMELMPSGTLWDRFTGPGLPVDQACGLMLCASAALHVAHARGILHRDVKPENFLFSAGGIMKLGDFGIAKLLDATQGHTLTGQIIGTPAYMAPEQASGEAIGPYTDVYACAVMLYELLTGELPFAETQEPLGQLMSRLTKPPRPITTTRPDVPRDIGLAVMTGLERDPAARFPSALAFGESLARSATAAFGPGWLIRSGVEVLGAQNLVAITSAPVTGGAEAEPIAKRTVRPTMAHVRVDDVMAVGASAEQPAVATPPPAATVAPAPYPPAYPATPTPPSVGPPVAPPPDPPAYRAPDPAGAPPPAPTPAPADAHLTVAPQAYPQAPPAELLPPPPPVTPFPPPQPLTAPPGAGSASPDPHAATIGARPAYDPAAYGQPAQPYRTPGAAAPGVYPPMAAPAAKPRARRTGLLIVTLLVVATLFGGGGYLLVRSRASSATGGDGASTTAASGTAGDAPVIEELKAGSGTNTQVVTWSDPTSTAKHYLYAIGTNFSNVVAADQSPTTVALPAGGAVCFVLANNDLSTKSPPKCANGGSADLVPDSLKATG